MSVKISNPFEVCFSLLKMRYKDYDESLTSKDFLLPTDKINVFINLESIFKNLSMIPELEKKIVCQSDFDPLMVSCIINLAAHYYRFFRSNNLDTRVYLYNTDFESNEFDQYRYNESFRSYYLVKYNENPKFVLLTDHLKESILPHVKVITNFIPNVYYISANNIEGSLVPYIIANQDPSRKNLVVSNEWYDTQYSFIPNFVNHLIHRSKGVTSICSSLNDYIPKLFKADEINDELSNLLQSYDTYCSLMSIVGDKSRSIMKVIGYGPKTFMKDLQTGIIEQVITKNTSNPEIIGEIFHDNEIKKDFINNYYCTNIASMYMELEESDKKSIFSQEIDRSDINALQQLNSSKFYNYPLLLEALLC